MGLWIKKNSNDICFITLSHHFFWRCKTLGFHWFNKISCVRENALRKPSLVTAFSMFGGSFSGCGLKKSLNPIGFTNFYASDYAKRQNNVVPILSRCFCRQLFRQKHFLGIVGAHARKSAQKSSRDLPSHRHPAGGQILTQNL